MQNLTQIATVFIKGSLVAVPFMFFMIVAPVATLVNVVSDYLPWAGASAVRRVVDDFEQIDREFRDGSTVDWFDRQLRKARADMSGIRIRLSADDPRRIALERADDAYTDAHIVWLKTNNNKDPRTIAAFARAAQFVQQAK